MIRIKNIIVPAAFLIAGPSLLGQGKFSGGNGDGFSSITYLSYLSSGALAKFKGGGGDGYAGISGEFVWYVLAKVHLWLEGPYTAGGGMRTDLQTGGPIPTTSPYTDARESDPVPAGVTDWVLVELRGADGTTVRSYRSFFLKSDGSVVDTDGSTVNCRMPGAGDGDYHIAIKHRNHLAVMSAAEETLNHASASLFDFSTGTGQYAGADAKLLETGVYGLYAGDANGSGTVDASDRSAAWNDRNQSGYLNADCDLSGAVDASDRSITWNNRNMSTSAP
jgi:hypothetical protein